MFYLTRNPSWLLVFLILFSSACQKAEELEDLVSMEEEKVKTLPNTFDTSGEVIPNQYLVILKSDAPLSLPTTLEDRKNEREPNSQSRHHMKALPQASQYPLLAKYGISDQDVLEAYEGDFAPGFLLNIDKDKAKELSKDPSVETVEEDKVIAMSMAPLVRTPFIPSGGSSYEWIPYGTQIVGGSIDFAKHADWNKRWAWILDTGIDYDHTDLHVNTRYSIDYTGSRYSFDDRLGHGTHVAGIVGAKNNSYGMQGVAAGAVLVAVKVLSDEGVGSTSTVVNGLRHIYRNALKDDVINISLGGSQSQTIANSINYLGSLGVRIVIAAGNTSEDAENICPANINGSNVYTIGAVKWGNYFSSYSNYGSSLDYLAPGDGIFSTYKGGQYAYMGGTSMAAPHVTGILLLTKGNNSIVGYAWAKDRYVAIPRH